MDGAAERHREALGIWRTLADEVGGPESRSDLAVSLNDLGVVQGRRGDLEGAAERHREALGIRRALADEVGGPESRSALADSLHYLGAVQESRGDLDGPPNTGGRRWGFGGRSRMSPGSPCICKPPPN